MMDVERALSVVAQQLPMSIQENVISVHVRSNSVQRHNLKWIHQPLSIRADDVCAGGKLVIVGTGNVKTYRILDLLSILIKCKKVVVIYTDYTDFNLPGAIIVHTSHIHTT